jgi:hypothetical protein
MKLRTALLIACSLATLGCGLGKITKLNNGTMARPSTQSTTAQPGYATPYYNPNYPRYTGS